MRSRLAEGSYDIGPFDFSFIACESVDVTDPNRPTLQKILTVAEAAEFPAKIPVCFLISIHRLDAPVEVDIVLESKTAILSLGAHEVKAHAQRAQAIHCVSRAPTFPAPGDYHAWLKLNGKPVAYWPFRVVQF